MGKGVISIDLQLLKELLLLPDDYKPLYTSYDLRDERCFFLIVESDTIPEPNEDGYMPHVTPIHCRSSVEVTRVDTGEPVLLHSTKLERIEIKPYSRYD